VIKSIIVFDGYDNGPSTKDREHERRSSKCSTDIVLGPSNKAYNNQSAFLANERNKAGFIKLLMNELKSNGHTVYQTAADADTSIVKMALDVAESNVNNVIVVASDTGCFSFVSLPLWSPYVRHIHAFRSKPACSWP
jgi:hypothetical protein